MTKNKVTTFDEISIIRVLERLDHASAIHIKPTTIIMHPDFFKDWVSEKHGDLFPPTKEMKFGRMPLKVSTHVKTWAIMTEPYD